MRKVDITLHFDFDSEGHGELFSDLVKFLHDRLPLARALVHKPEEDSNRSKGGS